MMGALYPEREMWFARSHIATGGTTGSAVDMRNFADQRGSFIITVPPTLASAVTVTFETTTPDPASDGSPLASGWAALNQGGLCEDVAAMSVVIDPNDADFSATYGKIVRLPIQCRSAFIRAKLGAASALVTVDIVGKAARLTAA